MIYHCPPPLVEHPALFVAALVGQGLNVSVAEHPAHVVGTIARTMICFDLISNRFRGNLAVRVLPSKLSLSYLTPKEVRAFENVLLFDRQESQRRGDSFAEFTQRHRIALELLEQNPAATSVISAFAALQWEPIDSAIDEELRYALEHVPPTPAIVALVAEVREHGRILSAAVERQDFEVAVKERNLRAAALDRLHDACVSP